VLCGALSRHGVFGCAMGAAVGLLSLSWLEPQMCKALKAPTHAERMLRARRSRVRLDHTGMPVIVCVDVLGRVLAWLRVVACGCMWLRVVDCLCAPATRH
jgi:hypothetical protein